MGYKSRHQYRRNQRSNFKLLQIIKLQARIEFYKALIPPDDENSVNNSASGLNCFTEDIF